MVWHHHPNGKLLDTLRVGVLKPVKSLAPQSDLVPIQGGGKGIMHESKHFEKLHVLIKHTGELIRYY